MEQCEFVNSNNIRCRCIVNKTHPEHLYCEKHLYSCVADMSRYRCRIVTKNNRRCCNKCIIDTDDNDEIIWPFCGTHVSSISRNLYESRFWTGSRTEYTFINSNEDDYDGPPETPNEAVERYMSTYDYSIIYGDIIQIPYDEIQDTHNTTINPNKFEICNGNVDCAICLNNRESKSCIKLPCGHEFCGTCIIAVETRMCPLCRIKF